MPGPARHRLRLPRAALGAGALLLTAALVGGCRDRDASPDALREGLARYQAATAPAPGPAADGGTAGAPPKRPAPPAPEPNHLQVTVLDGQGIVEQDALGGDSDVYVVLTYAGETKKTAVDEDAIDPQWHDTFVFRYVPGEALTVALWDEDAVPFSDELLGTVTIFPDRGPDRGPDPGPDRGPPPEGAPDGGPGAAADAAGVRTLAFKDGENGTVRVRLELVP